MTAMASRSALVSCMTTLDGADVAGATYAAAGARESARKVSFIVGTCVGGRHLARCAFFRARVWDRATPTLVGRNARGMGAARVAGVAARAEKRGHIAPA